MGYTGTLRSEQNPLRSEDRQVVFSKHPDAALLILCGELSNLQEEGQRLWEVTPEEGEPAAADTAWEDYAQHIWPGIRRVDADGEYDPVRDPITMEATTIEGMGAKATVIKAVDEASGYRCAAAMIPMS